MMQGVTPMTDSVVDRLLRATNKDTGLGMSDMQIAANLNTIIAGALAVDIQRRDPAAQLVAIVLTGALLPPTLTPPHSAACSWVRDDQQRPCVCHLQPGQAPAGRGAAAAGARRVWQAQGAVGRGAHDARAKNA